jgi:hypothetical protein
MDVSSPLTIDETSIRYDGWRIVAVCFWVAIFGWSFGFYGQTVFVAELHRLRGWPTSLISSGTTLFYLLGALLPAARCVGKLCVAVLRLHRARADGRRFDSGTRKRPAGHNDGLILRSGLLAASRRMGLMVETREDALLTMRVTPPAGARGRRDRGGA